MVVEVIEEFDVLADEAEDHTPIATDGDRPEASQIALELMQAETRHVDLFQAYRLIENAQHAS